jgi:hypothetical protein
MSGAPKLARRWRKKATVAAPRVRAPGTEQRIGQQGKGFGAKTITYRTAGDAAEEGEREQDAGSKPGRDRDADRRRMGKRVSLHMGARRMPEASRAWSLPPPLEQQLD